MTYWSREKGLVIYNPSSTHKEELELLSLELGYWARLLDLLPLWLASGISRQKKLRERLI